MSSKWICLKCDSVNEKSKCYRCEAKRFNKGIDVVEVNDGTKSIYVKVPTIWRRNDSAVFSSKSKEMLAKCPQCNMVIYFGDCACLHCQHVLTEAELHQQEAINHFGVIYYLKSIAIWCVAIGVLAYLIS